MQLDGLDGRVAVVTGAARGIGLAIARTLRDQGAKVAAADLAPPEEDGVLGLQCDVADEGSVGDMFDRVENDLGPADILVLNAGIFRVEPFEAVTVESWDTTLRVNLTGAFLCAKRALPGMRERGYGRVIAIGSSAGKAGGAKSVAAYAASKAGLMTLTKSLAREYASAGVTANALAPALIDTEMAGAIKDAVAAVPLGRLGRPQEVADLVAFLASSHGSFITGEVVDINGGFLID